MPTTYKKVECFCLAETSSETVATVIDDERKHGYTYCGNQNEMDGGYSFLFLVFKKDEVEMMCPAEID